MVYLLCVCACNVFALRSAFVQSLGRNNCIFYYSVHVPFLLLSYPFISCPSIFVPFMRFSCSGRFRFISWHFPFSSLRLPFMSLCHSFHFPFMFLPSLFHILSFSSHVLSFSFRVLFMFLACSRNFPFISCRVLSFHFVFLDSLSFPSFYVVSPPSFSKVSSRFSQVLFSFSIHLFLSCPFMLFSFTFIFLARFRHFPSWHFESFRYLRVFSFHFLAFSCRFPLMFCWCPCIFFPCSFDLFILFHFPLISLHVPFICFHFPFILLSVPNIFRSCHGFAMFFANKHVHWESTILSHSVPSMRKLRLIHATLLTTVHGTSSSNERARICLKNSTSKIVMLKNTVNNRLGTQL